MTSDPASPVTPSPEIASLREAFASAHQAFITAPEAQRAASLCLLAGQLSLHDAPPLPLDTASRAKLHDHVMAGLGMARLTDDAALLLELLETLEDEEERGSAQTPSERDVEALVREAFAQRDHAAWLEEGARCLLGTSALNEADALGAATFDETLFQELPRFTRWNHVRAEGLASAPSAQRRRFRWRTEAVGIAPGAWEAMSEVAALVAAHPEAEARFVSLLAAARGLRAAARAR